MLVRSGLQSLADPITHSRVLNVHEFGTDGVGINSLQAGNHLAQGHRLIVEEEFG